MHSFLNRISAERLIVALGAIIFLSVPVLRFNLIALKAVDFKTVYSSAKCLKDGCDPYVSSNLLEEYTRSGGDTSARSDMTAFKPYQALYPPSSLFWVMPFTLFPWRLALALWLTVSGVLFVIAGFLMADIVEDWGLPVPVMLIGLFLGTSMMLMLTAQPSGIAIGLCVIGVWTLLRDRHTVLGAVCFALSLALKPQIGGLVLVYFLFSRGPQWRRAFSILVLAGVFCLPGVFWAAHSPGADHWPQKMSRNIAGSSKPGSINDPGPNNYNGMLIADLQPVVAIFSNVPKTYNRVSWAIGGSLLLIWCYVTFRADWSRRKDFLGLASIACLSILPIYHRNYDLRLLLLTFPAVAMLMYEGGAAGVTAMWASIAVTFGSHSEFINRHIIPHVGTQTPLKQLLLLRSTPLATLAAGLFYLTLFAKTLGRQRIESVTGVEREEAQLLRPAS